MNNHTRLTSFAFILFVALGVMSAQAQITGTLSNFDVRNNSGQEANDFHVGLDLIEPGQFGNFYLGDYPSVNMTDTGTGVNLDWTGGTTPAGGTSHFGFTISGDSNPSAVAMYWTRNGVNIDSINDAKQQWQWLVNAVRDEIVNTAPVPLWVERRVAVTTADLGLVDLMVGGALWNGATIVDLVPVSIEPGASLIYDYAVQPSAPYSAVMMYNVYEDVAGIRGPLRMTYLNAATVPEPSSLSLAAIALAGLTLLAQRRSNRQTTAR